LSAWGGGLERGAEGAEKKRPKASMGLGMGRNIHLPSVLVSMGSVVSSQRGEKKTVLLLSKRVGTPLVAFVEN